MKNLSDRKINFMGVRKVAMVISIVMVITALASLATRGLNFGIDFTGGTLVELAYQSPVELKQVRETLDKGGFDDAVVQHFGTPKDILVRIGIREGVSQNEIGGKVLKILQAASSEPVERRRNEYVGPQVGEELTEQGGLAMLYALIGILIYVALRFEYRFAVGSVAALVHDVMITLGIFSIFQFEFDLPVLAALLAVIGYSLNDTIVVFDRIRENFRRMRKGMPVEIMNVSINQTLSRTLVTSLTTLLVLIALFILGGEVIHGFALALIIGVMVGTYSSIYVASTVTLKLGVSKADLMQAQKEEIDNMP
ncbi:MAG: protein translocase subunit SecF [Gammaproteobacteria bacterium]|nr:protein translocase subunit SecF [Gammaproteobacteria bacterium]